MHLEEEEFVWGLHSLRVCDGSKGSRRKAMAAESSGPTSGDTLDVARGLGVFKSTHWNTVLLTEPCLGLMGPISSNPPHSPRVFQTPWILDDRI